MLLCEPPVNNTANGKSGNTNDSKCVGTTSKETTHFGNLFQHSIKFVHNKGIKYFQLRKNKNLDASTGACMKRETRVKWFSDFAVTIEKECAHWMKSLGVIRLCIE